MNQQACQSMADDHTSQATRIIEQLAIQAGMTLDQVGITVKKQMNGNLIICRERHHDEMWWPRNSPIDIQASQWTKRVEYYAECHIDQVARLEARRCDYDPDNAKCYEPCWTFDIHPITAVLLRYYEDAGSLPLFDRTHCLNGNFGREVVFDKHDADCPIESMSIGYGSGVIRMGTTRFHNGMLFSYQDAVKVPYMIIPETYPESILASIKGQLASTIIDIFAGQPGIDMIKVTNVEKHALGTRLDFTNHLIPWESSPYDKAPWRQTTLKAGTEYYSI